MHLLDFELKAEHSLLQSYSLVFSAEYGSLFSMVIRDVLTTTPSSELNGTDSGVQMDD